MLHAVTNPGMTEEKQ